MIITVTLNPAMDKTVNIDNFSLGTVNRIQTERYDIGGKGINVSKVLKNFGIDSICTGFLGGIWENAFKKELAARGIADEFIRIDDNTRTNMKIVDIANGIFTDINAPGPLINEAELDRFLTHFTEICKQDDIVVLSGGVAPGIPKDIYARLIKISKKKGARVILDAEGELLQEGIDEIPNILKPNSFELAKLMDIDENNSEEIIKAAVKLKEKGMDQILVSLGENGALYICDHFIYHADGIKVNVRSTVGAGDSMVAALVYSMINNFNDEETLRFANACGAASVSLEGTEACTLSEVNTILKKIKIEKWEM
jgi:1-phosphofructokinase